MRFWDAPAVVPLLVHERASPSVEATYREDPEILAWWGTQVECTSAIVRLERRRQASATVAAEAAARLATLRDTWHEVQPQESVREAADRFLRVHDLRAGDALQLAAAFLAAGRRPPMLTFVCLDERLSRAARREGFPLLVPAP